MTLEEEKFIPGIKIKDIAFMDSTLEEAEKLTEKVFIHYDTIIQEEKNEITVKIVEASKQIVCATMSSVNKDFLLVNKEKIQDSFPYLEQLLKLVYIEKGKTSRKTEKKKKENIKSLSEEVEVIECKTNLEAPFSNAIYREKLQSFLLNKRTEPGKYVDKTEKNKQGFQRIIEINAIGEAGDVELNLEDLQVIGKVESLFLEHKEQVNNKYLDSFSLTIKKSDYQNMLNKNIKGARLDKIFECLDRISAVKIEIIEYSQYKKYLPNKYKDSEKPYYDKQVFEEKTLFKGRLLDYALCLNKSNNYTLTFFFPLFEQMKSDNGINRNLIPKVNELSLKEALEYQISRKLSSMVFIRKNKLINTNADSGSYSMEIKYETLLEDLNIEKSYTREGTNTNMYLKRFQKKIIKALGLIKDIEIDKCIVPSASKTTYKKTKIIVVFNYSKKNMMEII